jgi:hypothetical protein
MWCHTLPGHSSAQDSCSSPSTPTWSVAVVVKTVVPIMNNPDLVSDHHSFASPLWYTEFFSHLGENHNVETQPLFPHKPLLPRDKHFVSRKILLNINETETLGHLIVNSTGGKNVCFKSIHYSPETQNNKMQKMTTRILTLDDLQQQDQHLLSVTLTLATMKPGINWQ